MNSVVFFSFLLLYALLLIILVQVRFYSACLEACLIINIRKSQKVYSVISVFFLALSEGLTQA